MPVLDKGYIFIYDQLFMIGYFGYRGLGNELLNRRFKRLSLIVSYDPTLRHHWPGDATMEQAR